MTYVERIQLEAVRIFANKQKADVWLNQPKANFDDCTPLEIARDESGYLRVKDVLDKIDHGYSF
ncbi:hypothetical protein D3C81_831710 [compost metagenome]